MKNPFQPGDVKIYETDVTTEKLARFAEEGLVHEVYSTFALAADAEWACRLFVLEMKEEGEEGVGAFVSVQHLSPAPLGSRVRIEAYLEEVIGNRVECAYRAFCGERVIAEGKQTQRIVQKAKFDALIATLR